jgi:hypothetical protein
MTREQFDRIKAKSEAFGYTVLSKCRKSLRVIRREIVERAEDDDLVVVSDRIGDVVKKNK